MTQNGMNDKASSSALDLAKSLDYVATTRPIETLESGELDMTIWTRLEEIYSRGFGDGKAFTYDVDAEGEREFTITPKGQYVQWVEKRAAKEYPNVDKPLNVCPVFDPTKKYFKDWSPLQALLRFSIGRRVYDITTNNRPLLRTSLLISRHCSTIEEVQKFPQVMTEELLQDMLTLQRHTSLQLLFNGWEAGASVNQFHMQGCYAESIPVVGKFTITDDNLEDVGFGLAKGSGVKVLRYPQNSPKTGYLFECEGSGSNGEILVRLVAAFLKKLQASNVPQSVCILNGCVYIFMRNPSSDRSIRLKNTYIGCYELAGVLSVYLDEDKALVWGSDDGINAYFRAVKFNPEEAQSLLHEVCRDLNLLQG